GVGEHHRPDSIASAPAVVLAAIATRTERIRLTSAVSVISSDDPVRVFQDFATLDLLSDGRAEIMAGRGSFIESFPLFGYDLNDYDALFAEKLDLLLALRRDPVITWRGRHRAPIDHRGVYPRGLPLTIAIIGGQPAHFVPLAQLYRRSWAEAGHDEAHLRLSTNSHTYVADDSQRAGDEYFPAYAAMMNRIGRERGWAPLTREQFEVARGPEGALLVGDPEEVAAKIVRQHGMFGHDRFTAQISVGPLPHERVMRAIELLGREVAPRVRRAVAAGATIAGSERTSPIGENAADA
ncbi:MAG TPA: LLM class flavin-dependent oxidoreductase, partial [Miltoncostaeaceae bacterium]|nr:LLM class flavin-dependent oxidoreductase [Miltoncostaeaceae bacterium]